MPGRARSGCRNAWIACGGIRVKVRRGHYRLHRPLLIVKLFADVVTVSTSPVDSGHSKPGYREYRASNVICTLPLGVLQRQPPAFEPRLPPRKQRAIRSLGYGLLSKIAIRYDNAWWKESDRTSRQVQVTALSLAIHLPLIGQQFLHPPS